MNKGQSVAVSCCTRCLHHPSLSMHSTQPISICRGLDRMGSVIHTSSNMPLRYLLHHQVLGLLSPMHFVKSRLVRSEIPRQKWHVYHANHIGLNGGLQNEVPSAEEQAAAIKALVTAEPRLGGAGWAGSHLMRCPRGHVYFIGDCGGAVTQSSCAECGATIGGVGYALAAGNAVVPMNF